MYSDTRQQNKDPILTTSDRQNNESGRGTPKAREVVGNVIRTMCHSIVNLLFRYSHDMASPIDPNATAVEELRSAGFLLPDAAVSFPENADPLFVLSNSSVLAMQRYVNSIISIPAVPDTDEYKEGRALESSAKKNANEWRKDLYPATVACANAVAIFADVPIAAADTLKDEIGADGDVSRARETYTRDIMPVLLEEAKKHLKVANALKQRIVDFRVKVEKDKADAEELNKKLDAIEPANELEKKHRDLLAAIAKIQKSVEDEQAEYEKHKTVALTTLTYAWVPFVGWIVAAIVAGVEGSRATASLAKLAGASFCASIAT
jgi:hypothetical protein